MKLSKLFHTLYATVMALPVLVIPIFALNILHKETEPISIEVQNQITVDFNQTSKYTNLANANYIDNYFVYSQTNGSDTIEITQSTPVNTGHILLVKIHLATFDFQDNSFAVYLNETQPWTNTTVANKNSSTTENLYTLVNTNETSTYKVILYSYVTHSFSFTIKVQTFDLTQMFGEGNEPSIIEFNTMFTDNYYPYVLSKPMLVNSLYPTIYNNTDIGSQFVYALYKPVNDYFNFGDFFGLGGMYDWFQLNIFNGTAPLSFYIVFNVMIYWLFISLFWLLFDILIYVPMVIHKWLDKAEM